jgi:subtilisin family serine protease
VFSDADSLAAKRVTEKGGVVIVSAAGNSGASGLFTLGSPALSPHVIGVCSFDNVETFYPVLRVTAGTGGDAFPWVAGALNGNLTSGGRDEQTFTVVIPGTNATHLHGPFIYIHI